jgi:ubiquinol-cytochrome c reductase cytochrome b subunit
MLRAVPDKFAGFLVMAAAIAIMFVLPWLDRSPVKSMRYKGTFSRVSVLVFAAVFIILGVLGVKSPTPERTLLAQICTILYFLFFLGMPIWTKLETTKPEPARVTMNGGMGFWKTLVAFLIVAFLCWAPLTAVGAQSGLDCGTIHCDEFEADLSDKASLQNGAKLFVNYCMGCHSAKYSRWERVANDLHIPVKIAADNLVLANQKIGSLMDISMPADKAKQWFGAAPPDLTLVARARSPEWVYTYLRHFYVDPSRAVGVNNKVFKDVGMPHALLDLQGLQDCAPGPVIAHNGGIKRDPLTRAEILDDDCGRYTLVEKGKLSPEEYDSAVFDLVNFLTYVAEPMAEDRKRIGTYTLLFLAFLFIWVWLLNREYWKDIH